ncbi:MAG: beta-ketoacyl-[acyl-carrier-protein] synthase family protein [Myxococcota bacterium]|nr:beta-ketoacyl-[acyl-carrier-protein] synthase family protein [Myxococcota bacterium]
MQGKKNDIWITGIGIICSAGSGYDHFCSALQSHRIFSSPADSSLPVEQLAVVPSPIKAIADFPNDRKSWLAMDAAAQAFSDAGYPQGVLSIFMGTGLSSITPRQMEEDLFPHIRDGRFDRVAMAKDLDVSKVGPRRNLPHRLVEHLKGVYEAKGRCATNFSACAAAAQAIAEGYRVLKRGESDIAMVGGHDSMAHPMGLLSFVVLGALSNSFCRPFDRSRNGFMLGEGSAVLILERAEHARSRGAKPYAKVVGTGSSVDAWNVTAPHPNGEGAEKAMHRALRDASLDSSEIGYINAHGTGTPIGDEAESKAISRVFGDSIPVSSIKGAFGHCIAAAGAIEAVASVAAIEKGCIWGTVGLEEKDDFSINAQKEPQEKSVKYVLSNSFGFGGQNCSLIFGAV